MRPLVLRRRRFVKVAVVTTTLACCLWLYFSTTNVNHLIRGIRKVRLIKGEKTNSVKRPDFYAVFRKNANALDTKATIRNLTNSTHNGDAQTISLGIHVPNSSVPKMAPYKYYLSEILMVRIYKSDLAKWTIKELKQWMHYLFYAGVEHIYLCDHYVSQNESLKGSLLKYVDKGLLTYIPWPWNASTNGGEIMTHQVRCYSYVMKTFGKNSNWFTSIDMDEYPFCSKDFQPNFLAKYLKKMEQNEKFSSVSQILMENFLMLGQGDRKRTMVIERICRITKKIANKLTKPIIKSSDTSDVGIHKHHCKIGKTIHAAVDELFMLHYWGARLQNWSSDTEEMFRITNDFTSVVTEIAPRVRESLISFGETDAFSNVTGP